VLNINLFVLLFLGALKLIVSVVYFPPNSEPSLFENHCADVELLSSRYPDSKFLICDYNLPDFKWLNLDDGVIASPKIGATVKNSESATFLSDSYSFLNLNQHNTVVNSTGNTRPCFF